MKTPFCYSNSKFFER